MGGGGVKKVQNFVHVFFERSLTEPNNRVEEFTMESCIVDTYSDLHSLDQIFCDIHTTYTDMQWLADDLQITWRWLADGLQMACNWLFDEIAGNKKMKNELVRQAEK